MNLIKEDKYQSEISRLTNLLEKLNQSSDLDQRISILKTQPEVAHFLQSQQDFASLLNSFENQNNYLIFCLLVLKQGEVIFHHWQGVKEIKKGFARLLLVLKQVEDFYHPIGGIIGYHMTILKLIQSNEKASKNESDPSVKYYKPQGIDLRHPNDETRQAIRWGIEHLPLLAVIYPVGGAGDRLNLIDEKTGEPLPAAQLRFFGLSLLEHLIMDLQAKEYLYFKCFKERLLTPIAMMTSKEKNNDYHIRAMCEELKWFGRPPDSFVLFTQPLVPVISKDGTWCASSAFHLILKPGGHGVIWKLLKDNKVFEWFEKQGRKYGLLRQINNVAAGVDNGILALTGWGIHHKKVFGFASCPRRLNAAEGMDILIEKAQAEGYDYCISNVEYTEFAKKGVYDVPVMPGSRYSLFPANTNILFADLKEVSETIEKHPIPGMIINMKTKTKTLTASGYHEHVEACRLESTMQNIADCFIDHFPQKITQNHHPLKLLLPIIKDLKRLS